MTAPRPPRRPTIGDVAAAAGVSPMTVSRVLNGGQVRGETRARVERAIADLRYAPSAAARSLAGGDEVRIGLLHANPSFAYLSAFLVGSLEQASRSNAQLIVEKCDDGDEASAVEHLARARVDGIVLPPPLCDAPAVLAAVAALGISIVVVATAQAPDGASVVNIDDHRAAYDMTRHLGALGHRRIGFVTGNPNQSASAARVAGYRAALARMALDAAEELIAPGLFTYRSGLDAADRLLALPDPPTAIFASNDDMAAAAVAVAHRRGLDVPRDLSVCGFDDTALATTIWPELTTIRQPVAAMSRTAVAILVETIRSGGGPRRVVADYTLIRRDSDAPPER